MGLQGFRKTLGFVKIVFDSYQIKKLLINCHQSAHILVPRPLSMPPKARAPAAHSANEDDDVYLSDKSQANDKLTSVSAMVREVIRECPAAGMFELDTIMMIMTVYPPKY
jgi:hypothetical protein